MKRVSYFGLDLVLVIAFSIMGRAAHGESLGFAGIVRTGAPFVVGTLAGWGILLLARRNGSAVTDGLIVLVSTVVIGNIVRVLIGDGTHWSFILVTVIFLTVLMLGWRVINGKRQRRSVR